MRSQPCEGCPEASANPVVGGHPLSLVYSTFLGAVDSSENVADLATDAGGNAYIVGSRAQGYFPTTANLDEITEAELSSIYFDASYLTTLSHDGSRLVFSTLLRHEANGVAVEPGCTVSCAAYLVGKAGDDFPVRNGFQPSRGVDLNPTKPTTDATVQKIRIDPSGAAERIYATYLGGSGADHANSVAIDADGNAYVTGWTHSPDFPLTQAVQPQYRGGPPARTRTTSPPVATPSP